MLPSKLQSILLKINNYFDKKEYMKLHPTVSRPGLVYLTAKVHKLVKGEGLSELTTRPVVSNTKTTTYETAKYLNSLLQLLGKSDYNFVNTENLQITLKAKGWLPNDFI